MACGCIAASDYVLQPAAACWETDVGTFLKVVRSSTWRNNRWRTTQSARTPSGEKESYPELGELPYYCGEFRTGETIAGGNLWGQLELSVCCEPFFSVDITGQ